MSARKAPPGTRSATRSSFTTSFLLDPVVYERLATPKDKKAVKITIKAKNIPGQSNPGSWQNNKSTKPKPKLQIPHATSKKKKNATGLPTPPPLVNPVSARVMAAFPTGRPNDANADMIQCKHCRKPVFKPAAPEHIRDCIKKKQEKALKKKEAKEAKEAAIRKEKNGGVSPEPAGDADGRRNSTKILDGAKKTSKKRKADGEAGPKKKRKKDEPKKTGRHRGPVDVERQCGVLMPNGQMCARSLTCKTHAMGLKRAVPGRSMRYDVLLAQYQKKNHAKQHRAAMEATGPAEEVEDPADVDSEEEKETIMAAITAYCQDDPFTGMKTMGAPLATWDPIPVQRRYNYIRLKGAMQSAFGNVTGPGIFSFATVGSGSFSRSSSVDPDSMTIEDSDEEMRDALPPSDD